MNQAKRLSDAQIIRLAAFERFHGRAMIFPPGPRRGKILEFASENSIAVASDDWCMDPIIVVIDEAGTPELSEVEW